MEDRIKEFLENTTTLIPIIFDEGQGKGIFPCITFHFFNEGGEVFAGGKAQIETANCQIDFWYKEKTQKIKTAIEAVKQAIVNEKTFTYPEKGHMVESTKGLYHTYYTFGLIKKGGE